ncbi:Uridine kinase [C1], partial [hydrothermal vent metagenome]
MTLTDAPPRHSPTWPIPGEKRPLIIGFAGGSGSGKTTIANAVVAAVGTDSVTLIQHDSYYRDQSSIPLEDRAKTNF